ncbi:MAG TPA: hypothetical protein VIL70_00270 [Chthoniobacterales bacterium]
MKTKHSTSSFLKLLRKIFRRSAPTHDPFLFLSMTLFNYTDGWNRTFSKEQYERSWA